MRCDLSFVQVLNFHTLGSANSTGAFFPSGVNGRINRPEPLQAQVRCLLFSFLLGAVAMSGAKRAQPHLPPRATAGAGALLVQQQVV